MVTHLELHVIAVLLHNLNGWEAFRWPWVFRKSQIQPVIGPGEAVFTAKCLAHNAKSVKESRKRKHVQSQVCRMSMITFSCDSGLSPTEHGRLMPR